MELVAAIVLALGLCWMLGRDDAHLRRGGFLRGPDGRATDADRVLEVELEVTREYTRSLRSRKGAECQL